MRTVIIGLESVLSGALIGIGIDHANVTAVLVGSVVESFTIGFLVGRFRGAR